MTIRVPNAGDASISEKGGTGDLLVSSQCFFIQCIPPTGCQPPPRRKNTLAYSDSWWSSTRATLDGHVDVRVPGGTQQGEEMVLKGRGVQPVFGGEKGDLFVSFLDTTAEVYKLLSVETSHGCSRYTLGL